MDNFRELGLDSNMFNLSSPLVQRDFTTGFDFVTQNERGAITRAFMGSASVGNAQIGTAVIGTANIGTLSFNEISGGTAKIGGTNNQSGLLTIKNESGAITLGSFSKDGIFLRDITNTVRFISPIDDSIYMRDLILGGTAQPLLGTPDSIFQIWNSAGSKYVNVEVDFGMQLLHKPLEIGTRYMELNGTFTPTAGTGNSARLYLDTSVGKTRLMCLFESGAAQVVATEP